MTKLGIRQRKELRDSAFAHIDPSGRRRLPIHDESHVRNALARFNQVTFEDEAARDTARTRLLKAAKKYGIVPIGFVDGQLRAHGTRDLPTGAVTFLLTDIVDSTGHLSRLGDRYGPTLTDVRRLIRTAVRHSGGREVDARGDEFFAVFRRAPSALAAAQAIQSAMGERSWPDGEPVRLRVGLHSGRPTLSDGGYVGISVHALNRICASGDGGQIVLSSATRTAIDTEMPEGTTFTDLGPQRLRGFREPETLWLAIRSARPDRRPRPR